MIWSPLPPLPRMMLASLAWVIAGLGWLLVFGLGYALYRQRKQHKTQLAQLDSRHQNALEMVTARDRGRLNIIENIPEALFMLDQEYTIVRANRKARELLGDATVEDTPFSSHIRQAEVLEVLHTANAEQRQADANCWLGNHYYNVLAQSIPANPGSRTRLALVMHDVTAQKRLEQANRNFLANASHELRTPLTAILGFIETLQTSGKDDAEALDQFLPIMHHEASRMQNLVKDLLALSRLQRETDNTPSDPVPLTHLITQEVNSLSLKAAKQKLQFKTSLAADITIKGQAEEISQLLQNLLENAVKYGAAGTAIDVHLEAPTPMPERGTVAAQLTITNQGPGIAEKDLARVTERFFRTAAARESSATGTGLGLAIVKHTVARHQGHLDIESSLAGPTTFKVWLPLLKS